MRNIFTKHPRSLGESYFQHFIKAFYFGIRLIFIAVRVMIHAIFPFMFEYSASNRIKKLNDDLQKRCDQVTEDES